MLITLSFKKSLIVEQFQGNYLKKDNSYPHIFFYFRIFQSNFNVVLHKLLL